MLKAFSFHPCLCTPATQRRAVRALPRTHQAHPARLASARAVARPVRVRVRHAIPPGCGSGVDAHVAVVYSRTPLTLFQAGRGRAAPRSMHARDTPTTAISDHAGTVVRAHVALPTTPSFLPSCPHHCPRLRPAPVPPPSLQLLPGTRTQGRIRRAAPHRRRLRRIAMTTHGIRADVSEDAPHSGGRLPISPQRPRASAIKQSTFSAPASRSESLVLSSPSPYGPYPSPSTYHDTRRVHTSRHHADTRKHGSRWTGGARPGMARQDLTCAPVDAPSAEHAPGHREPS